MVDRTTEPQIFDRILSMKDLNGTLTLQPKDYLEMYSGDPNLPCGCGKEQRVRNKHDARTITATIRVDYNGGPTQITRVVGASGTELMGCSCHGGPSDGGGLKYSYSYTIVSAVFS